jgi:hypothetical protein
MPFYAFRLDQMRVLQIRSNDLDDDVVTFTVFINNVDRGHRAGFFPSLAQGAVQPLNWLFGPFEVAQNDLVALVYSGTNTSDSQLDFSQQDVIEVKILNAIASGVVGALGGAVGSAVGTVLGLIGDPVGKFLGFSPPQHCNGLVFSNAVEFTGGGLDHLVFQGGQGGPPPNHSEKHFTHTLTDETTHDSSACGDVAQTEVTLSVLQVQSASVRDCVSRRFPSAPFLAEPLRRATRSNASSLRSLIGLRP